METIQNLYAVAASLTADPTLHRELVGRLAHHLAQITSDAAVTKPNTVTVTTEFVERVMPRLSRRQQEVWFTLLAGHGVRAAARQLGISHPAIIKHRKKILQSAVAFLNKSSTSIAMVAA